MKTKKQTIAVEEAIVVEKVKPCPFAKVEAAILTDNPRAVRLVPLKKKRTETLKEFLIKFFVDWNNEKNTIYVDDRTVQTPYGKRRSLGDLFMLCRYYYPTCKLSEVLNLLYNELTDAMPSKGFRSSWCKQRLKRMWYFDPKQASGYFDNEKDDEFGNDVAFYRKHLQKLYNE